jgi:hypothetical protein
VVTFFSCAKQLPLEIPFDEYDSDGSLSTENIFISLQQPDLCVFWLAVYTNAQVTRAVVRRRRLNVIIQERQLHGLRGLKRERPQIRHPAMRSLVIII